MKSIAVVVLSAICVLALCGCQNNGDATYFSSSGFESETITLHRDGTFTRFVQHYAEDDKHRRKENPFETLTTSGLWSLVSGQDHLPNGFPVGGLVSLHSSADPAPGSHTMPMIGSRADQFGHFSEYRNRDRVLPAADFSNTFRAIRN